jgi:hypothetical protein
VTEKKLNPYSLGYARTARVYLERVGLDVPDELDDMIAYGELVQEWLGAEARWRHTQRQAEVAKATNAITDGPSYKLAAKGWNILKESIPNLDGVARFQDMPPSLQSRYALIAAVAADIERPELIGSTKSIMKAANTAERYSPDDDWQYCEQCNDYH